MVDDTVFSDLEDLGVFGPEGGDGGPPGAVDTFGLLLFGLFGLSSGLFGSPSLLLSHSHSGNIIMRYSAPRSKIFH